MTHTNATSNKSTNGRSLPFLRLATRIAPGPMERYAATMFFTPRRRRKVRPAEHQLLKQAKQHAIMVRGRSLVCWHWAGHGPTVLLVHGWQGNAAQMTPFVEPLRSRGYSVVAIDLPAHGASGGRRTHLIEAMRVLDACVRRFGPIHATIGHSFGANGTLLAASRSVALGDLILIGPMMDPTSILRDHLSRAGLSPQRQRRVTKRIEQRLAFPITDLNAVGLIGTIDARFLLITDTEDEVSNVDDLRLLAAAHPETQTFISAGYGHHRLLRAPEVIDRVTKFLGRAEKKAKPTTRAVNTWYSHCATPGCGHPIEATDTLGAPRCMTCLISGELANPDLRAFPTDPAA